MLFHVAAAIFLASLLAMTFQPLTMKQALSAIGSTQDLAVSLQRLFRPDGDFELLPSPQPGDWLAEHHESGQSFDEFKRCGRNLPESKRNIIYLQPLGKFLKDSSPSIELLKQYSTAFFMMEVKILPSRSVSGSDLKSRLNPYSRNQQFLTTDILSLLSRELANDAFCILGITMEDLYPDPRWNFVFGQASLRDRVGVFSFARYNPAFYGEKRNQSDQELLLRRSCKVMAHETAHMFSLAHCIYFKCVMNGSNHLQESDARPLWLCPVCLRKLHLSIGFDPVRRYESLLRFYRNADFEHEAQWVSKRLLKISDFD